MIPRRGGASTRIGFNLTSELALNLDSDTNNTSLVLAFRAGRAGQRQGAAVAADAQVGNWLSWAA